MGIIIMVIRFWTLLYCWCKLNLRSQNSWNVGFLLLSQQKDATPRLGCLDFKRLVIVPSQVLDIICFLHESIWSKLSDRVWLKNLEWCFWECRVIQRYEENPRINCFSKLCWFFFCILAKHKESKTNHPAFWGNRRSWEILSRFMNRWGLVENVVVCGVAFWLRETLSRLPGCSAKLGGTWFEHRDSHKTQERQATWRLSVNVGSHEATIGQYILPGFFKNILKTMDVEGLGPPDQGTTKAGAAPPQSRRKASCNRFATGAQRVGFRSRKKIGPHTGGYPPDVWKSWYLISMSLKSMGFIQETPELKDFKHFRIEIFWAPFLRAKTSRKSTFFSTWSCHRVFWRFPAGFVISMKALRASWVVGCLWAVTRAFHCYALWIHLSLMH